MIVWACESARTRTLYPLTLTQTMPTYVVTGTSSGIGLELTKQILAMEDTVVYATVRTRKSSASGEDAIGALAARTETG